VVPPPSLCRIRCICQIINTNGTLPRKLSDLSFGCQVFGLPNTRPGFDVVYPGCLPERPPPSASFVRQLAAPVILTSSRDHITNRNATRPSKRARAHGRTPGQRSRAPLHRTTTKCKFTSASRRGLLLLTRGGKAPASNLSSPRHR
jgi:hypothetical protein